MSLSLYLAISTSFLCVMMTSCTGLRTQLHVQGATSALLALLQVCYMCIILTLIPHMLQHEIEEGVAAEAWLALSLVLQGPAAPLETLVLQLVLRLIAEQCDDVISNVAS